MAQRDDPVKIDKTLLNYSGQVIRYFLSKNGFANNNPVSGHAFITLLQQGIKFMFPEEGRMFTDTKLLLPGLPYPVTVIEFPFSREGKGEPGIASAHAMKRVAIAVDIENAPGKILSLCYQAIATAYVGHVFNFEGFKFSELMGKETCRFKQFLYSSGNDPQFFVFQLGGFKGGDWLVVPSCAVVYKDGYWSHHCVGDTGLEFLDMIKKSGKDEEEIHEGNIIGALTAVYQLSTALSYNNVTTERFCSYPRTLRRKNNKKKPIFEYHILTIKPGKNQQGTAQGGTNASPRVHLRRGHLREYQPWSFTWVQPCVVGSKKLGVIHKDYKVRGRRQTANMRERLSGLKAFK